VRYTCWGAKAKGKPELAGTKRTVISGRYELEDIIKHSKNIIDLVEKDDYVNGEIVIEIFEYWENLEDGTKKYCGRKILTANNEQYLYETDIKTIVTKEAFKSVEYVF
jgi:hypothetical protein